MPKYESPYKPSMTPKDLKFVIYEKKDHIAYVTINRPEVRNALHTYSHLELRKCWRDIQLDPDIRVAIVTGAGDKAFCGGRDVKFLAEYQKKGIRTPHEDPTNDLYRWGAGGTPSAVGLNKPVIAAINGLAVGVGTNLLMECDLRVMAEDAWIGDQHTNVGRLGAPQQLFAGMPAIAAAFCCYCNGRLTAQRCLQWGIVNEVVPRAQLISKATELAQMIVAAAPMAVQSIKRIRNLTTQYNQGLISLQMQLDQECAESEDGAEGPRAFTEKRKPNWKNVASLIDFHN
jgi:enoyl-CoA hydratase/carnithine racemase